MSDIGAPGRWQALSLICAGVVCAMTSWFSATAILPDLVRDWDLGPAAQAWLTNAVQLGFVVGAVAASFVNLPDIVALPRLMMVSAMVAALANAVLLFEPGAGIAIAARALTGAALAGVYPPAIKLMATWFTRGRGLALGFLIGALTLGSSMPHLLRALTEGLDWRAVVLGTTLATGLAAAIFGLGLAEGPHGFGRATFDPRQSLAVLRERGVMLANLGYFGHMWELYAMWAWFLAFATAAEAEIIPFPMGSASMLTFFVVASGALGCVLAGTLSDRIGRCATTAWMMGLSGASALAIGFAFDGPGWFLALVALVWGITVVADSAQFSAAVTELAKPHLVGTSVTLQLGIGFALTVLAIQIMPWVAEAMGGWRWAFLVLVPGPVLGTGAMLVLRRLPEAAQLAGGRR
ncbi:MFS family permease [Limimaricola variabilis]|uniref:MFS family permease n=1 Tax=Limimaricola variabilis TaxID=1492771 RepID=A0ABR6HSP6_9RHOB|nr:MFS transporter [Limimaricola variabilis]MBB3713450.1 MFS family permease [Limimaricola variabilis]